jgi:3-deoxy-D-manno-octulosonic-acid transferase
LRFLYTVFILLYGFVIRVASYWNNKAKDWHNGRKNLFTDLQQKITSEDNLIWMHCASAGEFEQGKPVLEALKKHYPKYKVLVSFFSPSGFNVAKKNPLPDYISYFPLDTKRNAERFIQIVQPKLVLFVKYEFWYYHLKSINDRKVPLLLISALFRKEQLFFKWYGLFYLKMLHLFSWIFVQDQAAYQLLKQYNIENCSINSDTRFDRVITIAEDFKEITFIKNFIGNSKVIVAGSTWPKDEELLSEAVAINNTKLIIAPHELDKDHIENLLNLFPGAVTFSTLQLLNGTRVHQNTLIIDNIGMLSRLYNYATITYIGRGFNKSGIHNTLEAAVYGKPVLFGPNYQKFKEARELIAAKAAFSVNNSGEVIEVVSKLMSDTTLLQQTGDAAKKYVYENKGATKRIIDHIQENRLLTS